ncbi:MAG: PilZ domain-containing protein [Desulfobacterales bacterium]|nr:PilZ domain-containing protein [Desulfobacterales bacterium]
MATVNKDTGKHSDRRNADRMPYPTDMRYRSSVVDGLGTVINISSLGMFFETPTPLTAGERLCIDFRFRNSHAGMEICGEITRTTSSGAGVRFLW